MFSHRISLVVALACLAVSANELVNPNLETDADGNLPGWKTYRPDNPLRVVHDDVQNGQSAIYGEISQQKPSFGFMQTLVYDKPDNRPVTFGGWSKSATTASIWTSSSRTARTTGPNAPTGRREPMTGNTRSNATGRPSPSRKSNTTSSCAIRRAGRGSTISS